MNTPELGSLPQLAVSTEPQDLNSLHLLETRLRQREKEVKAWFENQWQQTPPPVYGSVDLRNAGFKLAPVDMNLFPAGFNNLNPHFLPDTALAAKETILRLAPGTKTIALVPESHTRNLFYWENVRVLSGILKDAGFQVRLGSLSEEIQQATEVKLPSGQQLIVEPLIKEQERVRVGDYVPDFILLNNDLSAGIPPVLQQLKQPLFPPAELGWHQRLKSEHFQYYASLSTEFAALLELDPWLITPLFRHCGQIDFMNREGLDCLSGYTEALLADIQKKYDEYGVTQKPFAVIKADAGTQGMAVMTVRSIEELQMLNRKQRTSMSKSKGGIPVRRVIVQEGVYTIETFGPEASVAEPVVYMWGKQVVGGFYRIHEGRGIDENLNAPGMQFASSPFLWSCSSCPQEGTNSHPYQQHLYAYGVIAQLSMLAAAREQI